MRPSGVYKKGEFDIVSEFQEALKSLPKDVGAVLTFMGVTKRLGQGDKDVRSLEMESYEEHANQAIGKICEEVKEKYGVALVKIYHFVGEFDVGEPIVFALVASRFRSEAFPALREAVERYKTEPALWKKEVYIDGSHQWISHA